MVIMSVLWKSRRDQTEASDNAGGSRGIISTQHFPGGTGYKQESLTWAADSWRAEVNSFRPDSYF